MSGPELLPARTPQPVRRPVLGTRGEVLEVAGAAGLLIGLVAQLLGNLAGVGLLVLLTGAVATHLRRGDGLPKFAPAAGSWLFVAAHLAVPLGTAG